MRLTNKSKAFHYSSRFGHESSNRIVWSRLDGRRIKVNLANARPSGGARGGYNGGGYGGGGYGGGYQRGGNQGDYQGGYNGGYGGGY